MEEDLSQPQFISNFSVSLDNFSSRRSIVPGAPGAPGAPGVRIDCAHPVERIENPAGCNATLASCKLVSEAQRNNNP
jgi:hypothetical protein